MSFLAGVLRENVVKEDVEFVYAPEISLSEIAFQGRITAIDHTSGNNIELPFIFELTQPAYTDQVEEPYATVTKNGIFSFACPADKWSDMAEVIYTIGVTLDGEEYGEYTLAVANIGEITTLTPVEGDEGEGEGEGGGGQ